MSGALLGRDVERNFRNKAEASKAPSKLVKFGRNFLLSLICLFSVLTVGAGATAKAAIWDLGDEIVAGVMNICNPNSVPYTTDTKSWVDSALGATTKYPVSDSNNGGNIWSTYNPMVTPDGSAYVNSADEEMAPKTPTNAEESTRAFLMLLSATSGDKEFLYSDNWSKRDKVKEQPVEWWGMFKGDGDRNMYPVNPSSENAAYYNAPTVALQAAYANAPVYVKHPTYTRYGFETLDWTTYGASCYSPERYFNVVPSYLYWANVQIPTLITFGMLRITLGAELSGIFYMFVYPLTSLLGTFISPWAALIAIFIGLPYIWLKSKGSVQKLLGAGTWIAAMMFAITQLTTHAKEFTQFSQGLVVKVSGTLACTIANQAFADGVNTIKLNPDEVKQAQMVPQYDDKGRIMVDANGDTQYKSVSEMEQLTKSAAESGKVGENGEVKVSMDDLRNLSGTEPSASTACGSYLEGIYNAFWIGIPLQVWAEGQVGAGQAARDRVSQTQGRIGWYQATLNSMYINPEDRVGKAQVQAITRWNDGGYTAKITDDYFNIGKPAQWSLDGHTDEVWEVPVTSLDKEKNATVWKTIPFLLNVKFICKDQQVGTTEKSGMNGADNAGDYAGNKWLYDGTCITGGDAAVIQGLTGQNYIDRIGLALVGGVLSFIVFLFTVGICVYIGYQKFVWGFMLMFAPIFLGIAAFPDDKRRDFFRKYVEFCIANVVKQIMAVMILVVTVTALGRIIFPNAMDVGDVQFYIPWMLKPFVAIMFLLAAVMFAFPLKKIMVGAVKGDSSVVKQMPKDLNDGMKTAAGAAAAVGLAVATGGGSALGSAAMQGAGRAAQGMAMRKGGMQGALAAAAGDAMSAKAADINSARDELAKAHGITPQGTGLIGNMKRDAALKKKLGTKGMSERAALAANALAAKNGEALPYAVDAAGNLTNAGKRKALKDFVGAQKGNFTKAPEFSALARNNAANAEKLDAAKMALLPQFTDADGKVDEKGLNAAAAKQVQAENANMLARQGKLGQQMLAEDAMKSPEKRQYLDSSGKLTPEGQTKLLADVRALDSNAVNLANAARAHELISENPDKYNQFVTAENPNGNYIAALADANRQNFGSKDALIGAKPITSGLGQTQVQQLAGTQAYVNAQAPVVGKDVSAIEAASTVQALSGEVGHNDPAVQSALSNYSNTLQNPDATPDQIANAHAGAMTALHGAQGVTDASKMVNDQVLAPIQKLGMSVSPDVVRGVAGELPESSAALKQSLENYAGAIENNGADSKQAAQALQAVQVAADHEDKGVYASVAQSMPMPAQAMTAVPVIAPTSSGTAAAQLAPSVSPSGQPVSAPAPDTATLAPSAAPTTEMPAVQAQETVAPSTPSAPSVDSSAATAAPGLAPSEHSQGTPSASQQTETPSLVQSTSIPAGTTPVAPVVTPAMGTNVTEGQSNVAPAASPDALSGATSTTAQGGTASAPVQQSAAPAPSVTPSAPVQQSAAPAPSVTPSAPVGGATQDSQSAPLAAPAAPAQSAPAAPMNESAAPSLAAPVVTPTPSTPAPAAETPAERQARQADTAHETPSAPLAAPQVEREIPSMESAARPVSAPVERQDVPNNYVETSRREENAPLAPSEPTPAREERDFIVAPVVMPESRRDDDRQVTDRRYEDDHRTSPIREASRRERREDYAQGHDEYRHEERREDSSSLSEARHDVPDYSTPRERVDMSVPEVSAPSRDSDYSDRQSLSDYRDEVRDERRDYDVPSSGSTAYEAPRGAGVGAGVGGFLGSIADNIRSGRDKDESNEVEAPVEEETVVENVDPEENYDEAAEYRRENSVDDEVARRRRELTSELVKVENGIQKLMRKNNQLEGLIKRRRKAADNLPAGKERDKALNAIAGAQSTIDRNTNQIMGLEEARNKLSNALGKLD